MRWLRPETWHLTLLFLGAVPVERVPGLVRLVDAVASANPPFHLTVEGGGGRVRGSDGVGWLAVRDGARQVIDIADQLDEGWRGQAPDEGIPRRTPSAHLTVARRLDRATLDALTASRHGPLSEAWQVERMALIRSHLGRDGARYETLHEATLYPRVQ